MTESGKGEDDSIQTILNSYSIHTSEDHMNFYNSWAENYDEDIALINYRAHIYSAETLDPVFPKERENALVLDVACGTGLTAAQFQAIGFKNIHGIDGSDSMLKVAESKGLHQSLRKCMIVPDEQLPIPSDTYDLILVVGALSIGHLSPDVLPELLRITKPGAYVCLSVKDNGDSSYKQHLFRRIGE